jgi:hypothetical protein
VKGLWRNEKFDNVNVSTTTTTTTDKQSDLPPDYSEMVIKSEVDIGMMITHGTWDSFNKFQNDTDDTENQKTGCYSTHSLEREDEAETESASKEISEELLNSQLMNKETENHERAKKSLHKKDNAVLTKADSNGELLPMSDNFMTFIIIIKYFQL